MRCLVKTVITIVVVGLGLPVQAQRLPFHTYSTLDGLPQAQVSSVMQDSRGFIWFVSNSGLSRFDGTEFRTYTKQDGLPTNSGIQILEDSESRLWALMINGLAVFELSIDGLVKNLERFDARNGLPSLDYSCMLMDSNHTLWLGSRGQGLLKITMSQEGNSHRIREITTFNQSNGMISNVIHRLMKDRAGNLWIGTDQGITVLRASVDPVNFSATHGLRSPFVTSLAMDASGVVWIGTKSGLARFIDILSSPNLNKFEMFGLADGLPNEDVRSIAVDQLGNLWVGTASGLTKITFSQMTDPAVSRRRLRLTNYNEKNGLVDDLTRYVCADRENNIWISTYGNGISLLTSDKFHTFFSAEGLANETPGPIVEAPDGTVWVGTNQGISVFQMSPSSTAMPEYRIQNMEMAAGLPDLSIWDFALGRGSSIWVATERGIAHFDGHRFERPSMLSDIQQVVRQIEFDRHGNLWVGTTSGLFRWSPANPSQRLQLRGLPSDFIRRLTKDNGGGLWIGTNNGLARVRADQVDRPQPLVELPDVVLADRIINDLYEDRQHDLWVLTDGTLLKIDLDNEFNIKSASPVDLKSAGFVNSTLTCMEQDPSGLLWIGTNKGVHQFDPTTSKVIDVYFKSDGLGGEEGAVCDAMMVDRSGTLWMSLFGGVTRYLPALDITVNNEVRGYVKRFTANTSVKSLEHDQLLSAEERNIEIQFMALSFKRGGTMKYQYRLLGFEQEWSQSSVTPFARYTNLDHGSYVFQFRPLIPSASTVSPVVEFAFRIDPPVWKQWWFLLLTSSLVLGIAYAAYHRRIRRLETHGHELEYRIQLRTQEIRKQNDEINRQHQALEKQKSELEKTIVELSKAQTDLIHSKKMASLVQIVSGIAHEMNNPLANIYGNAVHFREYIESLKTLLMTYDAELSRIRQENHDLQTLKNKIDELKRQIEYDYMIDDIGGIVQSIEKSSTRMMQIMKDLRKFSRIDESEIKEVNLNESLESILELFISQYRFSITIDKSFAPLPPLLCYPQELNQAFMQMLLNAAQAILEYQELALREFKHPTLNHRFDLDRGHIRIETSVIESTALRDLDLSLQDIYRGAKKSFIQVRISDDGIGIQDDIREKVFDPFFTTRKIGEGIGLGLSVAYSIVEKHDGRIFFNSEYLKGTEFIVELPLKGMRL